MGFDYSSAQQSTLGTLLRFVRWYLPFLIPVCPVGSTYWTGLEKTAGRPSPSPDGFNPRLSSFISSLYPDFTENQSRSATISSISIGQACLLERRQMGGQPRSTEPPSAWGGEIRDFELEVLSGEVREFD